MTWSGIAVIVVLVGIAVVQSVCGLRYAYRRDRQAACRLHRWQRNPAGGLVCEFCGVVPGRILSD